MLTPGTGESGAQPAAPSYTPDRRAQRSRANWRLILPGERPHRFPVAAIESMPQMYRGSRAGQAGKRDSPVRKAQSFPGLCSCDPDETEFNRDETDAANENADRQSYRRARPRPHVNGRESIILAVTSLNGRASKPHRCPGRCRGDADTPDNSVCRRGGRTPQGLDIFL